MKKQGFIFSITVIALLSISIFSNAQVIIKIKPLRPKVVVVKPKAPGPNFVWINGHWKWSKRVVKYVWAKGHWSKRRRGANWVSGHWADVPGGHKWIPGHWKRR